MQDSANGGMRAAGVTLPPSPAFLTLGWADHAAGAVTFLKPLNQMRISSPLPLVPSPFPSVLSRTSSSFPFSPFALSTYIFGYRKGDPPSATLIQLKR